MKKILIILLAGILVGCSNKADEGNESEPQKPVSVDSISSITNDEALQIATEIIEELREIIYSIGPQYEGDEDFSKEWPDITPIATANYIKKYFDEERFNCDDQFCEGFKMPLDTYFGWNPQIELKDDKSFYLNTIFTGRFLDEDDESYLQSVHFKLEENEWKINEFTMKQQDMNLTMADVKPFMKTWSFHDIEDLTESSYEVNGVDEPAAYFIDPATEREFYLVLRTGNLIADVDEFDLYFSYYLNSDYYFLFEDGSLLNNMIDRTAPEIHDILTQLEAVDEVRQNLYFTYDIEGGLAIYEELNELLNRTYNYYYTFYEDETFINRMDYERSSWQEYVELHYASQGYETTDPYEMHFDQLVEHIYMMRNHIYNLMYLDTYK